MQKLQVKDLNNSVVTTTTFNSDKEARIAMTEVEINKDYKFEMANTLESNICVANYLQKILKDLKYDQNDEMDNNEIRNYLQGKVESAARLTNTEKNLISSMIDIMFPLQY